MDALLRSSLLLNSQRESDREMNAQLLQPLDTDLYPSQLNELAPRESLSEREVPVLPAYTDSTRSQVRLCELLR
jgi:hypothetical protein